MPERRARLLALTQFALGATLLCAIWGLLPARWMPIDAPFTLLALAQIAAAVGLTFLMVRQFYHGRLRRADPWDCGYPEQNARMEDSAEGFGQPIRHIFAPVYRIRREIPRPDDPKPVFRQEVDDRHWHALYLPIARFTEFLSSQVGKLQQGRISVYLLYSFLTLIALLVFAR